MVHQQCHIKDCKKKDHRDCKKPCEKPCKAERFDSWSESSDSCDKPHCQRKCYKVCETVCKQKRCEDKKWGHKTKEIESWKEVCEQPKLHQKCGHKKHHDNVRKH